MTLTRRVVRAAGSFELTTAGLLYLFVLVLAMTFAQSSLPVREAAARYMHSWFIFAGPVPVPAGQLVFAVLGVNLTVATLTRIPLRWNRLGILLAHGGLILLVAGGLVTRLTVRESVVALAEGETERYSYDLLNWDLVVETDEEIRFPLGQLPQSVAGVALGVDRVLRDASVTRDGEGSPASVRGATGIEPARLVRDSPIPGLLAELGGTPFLLHGSDPRALELRLPDDSIVRLRLLPARFPLPAEVTLNEFTAEFYEGTQIPRAFTSRVTVTEGALQRNAIIRMNAPLRLGDHTIYQLGYDSQSTSTEISLLQVVRNPARWLPYTVGLLVSLGLMIHAVIRATERRAR